jgi:hypothetical protein
MKDLIRNKVYGAVSLHINRNPYFSETTLTSLVGYASAPPPRFPAHDIGRVRARVFVVARPPWTAHSGFRCALRVVFPESGFVSAHRGLPTSTLQPPPCRSETYI